ncbi:hypothetical protein PYW07_012282 [Mythimna separata]|uniref:Uncharacterized protein n=1 Tax=Mythimna separata TaxID=271217 RepID=A0AAD8DTL9_MYTSE|nr:hypothetical protein PYW07_012282 [Mythimna separata]
MSYIYLLCILAVECTQRARGWEYLNLQCRDNGNEPVDWWYIYKPPRNTGPHMETGINYSYIDPNTDRKWTAAPGGILSESMLRYTIAPMFIEEYADYLAIMEYDGKKPTKDFMGSASRGMMMANSLGGIWIGHTIPGFPDITKGAPTIPQEELQSGHMIMCLTLDLITLNTLATSIMQTEPYIKRIFIPQRINQYVPDWKMFLSPLPKATGTAVRNTKVLHFVTRNKSLRGLMFARSPGDPRCLYKSFAKIKQIVLDVYGHREHDNIYCSKAYSIRNINSISLKFKEMIYYVNNATDKMGFAVSTSAHWQKMGLSKSQFWTCIGNVENQYRNSMGGLIACVNHFRVWLAFDHLKVKEPECNTAEDI